MPSRCSLRSTTMLSGVVGCGFLAASAAYAADISVFNKAPDAFASTFDPAVSALNAKLDGYGGSVGDKSVFGAKGSVSIPLPGQYGLQVDGNIGSLDGDAFGAVAGHWFWRNPNQALLGIYASDTFWDRFGGVSVTHVAAEGELYFGAWTLQGIAGIEFGNQASNTTVSSSTSAIPFGTITTTSTLIDSYDIQTRFFDQINLKYYFNSDVDAYVGHRYLGGKNALALGTELARPFGGGIMGAAFVEARVGEADFHGVWGGLKVYFGPTDKPLIARERRDDPPNWTFDNLFSILNNHSTTGSSSSLKSCTFVVFNGNCERGS